MSLSVVTGANRGIGLALSTLLRRKGHAVLAACRRSSAALDASGAEVVDGVDVSEEAGIRRLVQTVGDRAVDLLINNAGILVWGERAGGIDVEGIRRQFEVNALGPLRVTEALRPALRRGSKVALITSRMGSIEDNSSGGAYGYRMSKAALNMAGKSLAIDLKADGVAVAILQSRNGQHRHDQWSRTGRAGRRGQGPPRADRRAHPRYEWRLLAPERRNVTLVSAGRG